MQTSKVYPSRQILEPRRINQTLYAVVMEAYVNGVSPPELSTTWSQPWGSTPGSPSPRSPGSAPVSMSEWPRSGTEPSVTSRSLYIEARAIGVASRGLARLTLPLARLGRCTQERWNRDPAKRPRPLLHHHPPRGD